MRETSSHLLSGMGEGRSEKKMVLSQEGLGALVHSKSDRLQGPEQALGMRSWDLQHPWGHSTSKVSLVTGDAAQSDPRRQDNLPSRHFSDSTERQTGQWGQKPPQAPKVPGARPCDSKAVEEGRGASFRSLYLQPVTCYLG